MHLTYLCSHAQKPNRKKALRYFRTAQYHFKNYNFREAEVYLTRALKNDSTYFPIYKLRYKASYHSRKFRQAAYDLSQLSSRQQTQTGEVWYYKGLNAYHLEHYDASIEALNKARALGYHSPLLFAYLAEDYLNTAQYQKALDHFRQAMQIDPNEVGLILGRARCYYFLEKFPQCIADCERVMKLDSYYQSDCLHLQGMAYLALNDYDKAFQKLKTFVQIQKGDIDSNTLSSMVYCLVHQGKIKEAIQYCDKLIEADPQQSWWYYERANYHSKLKSLDKALEDNTRAISLESKLELYHLQKAEILFQKKDYAKAKKKLDALLDQEQNGRGYYLRANCRHALKEKKKSIRSDLQHAVYHQFDEGQMSKKMKAILHQEPFFKKLFSKKQK